MLAFIAIWIGSLLALGGVFGAGFALGRKRCDECAMHRERRRQRTDVAITSPGHVERQVKTKSGGAVVVRYGPDPEDTMGIVPGDPHTLRSFPVGQPVEIRFAPLVEPVTTRLATKKKADA